MSASAEQELMNGLNKLAIQPAAVGPVRPRKHRVRVNPVPARGKQRTVVKQGKITYYY